MEIRELFSLENDRSFQQLNKQVNSFNALKTLKLESYEIRHSNILAWLMDPKETHHLKDFFLRKVLENLLLLEDNLENTQVQAVEKVLNSSLVESHIYREVKTDHARYIDLVVVNHQLKMVILMENKFYSTESQNQLSDYLSFIQTKFPDYTIIPIYLTLDGETPSNPAYFSFTYEQIETILTTGLLIFEQQLERKVAFFIQDYCDLLNEKFYPNQQQILLSIEIYREHSATINKLFETNAFYKKTLHFEAGYQAEFVTKYDKTIRYIYNQGKNLLAHSFEKFLEAQFPVAIQANSHPTVPSFIPPEWHGIDRYEMKNPNYWLGKGLIIWFSKTNDNRLSMIVEIGQITYKHRLKLLEKIEQMGIPIKRSSKAENAQYTRIYTKKLDINKWEDPEELMQGMLDHYNDPEFEQLCIKVTAALNNENLLLVEKEITIKQVASNEYPIVYEAFKTWMSQKSIDESKFRITKRYLSFKLDLFDEFKELLGETRENWWWDNGPFLIWYRILPNIIEMKLEVGPIDPEQRILLLEKLQEQGISFNKKALEEESRFTRIFAQKVIYSSESEAEIILHFENLFNEQKLQSILKKLEIVYKDLVEMNS